MITGIVLAGVGSVSMAVSAVWLVEAKDAYEALDDAQWNAERACQTSPDPPSCYAALPEDLGEEGGLAAGGVWLATSTALTAAGIVLAIAGAQEYPVPFAGEELVVSVTSNGVRVDFWVPRARATWSVRERGFVRTRGASRRPAPRSGPRPLLRPRHRQCHRLPPWLRRHPRK